MNTLILRKLALSFALLFLVAQVSWSQSRTLKRANKEFELGAFNMAIQSYGQVLSKEPNNVEALGRMADCFRHLNKLKEAARLYDLAVREKGLDPIHYLQYGHTMMGLSKYDEAIAWYRLYAEGQPAFGNHFAKKAQFAKEIANTLPTYKIKNLSVNTPASDFGPTTWEESLVWSSSRIDLKRQQQENTSGWTGDANNQLFQAEKAGDTFSKASFLRSDLQNTYNEGPISFSGDGNWVAITRNNFVDGTRQIPSAGMQMSIYIAEVLPDGRWKEPVAFAFNGSGYSSGYPMLNEDGTVMYFASNRPDGFGGYDLYMTRRTGNNWSMPVNLGSVVNSPGNELTPFLDGQTLYFASDWHPGLGGFDIFKAEGMEQGWSQIFNLGTGVNSPRDDYGYVSDAEWEASFFTSNRLEGKGKEDIYQATLDRIVLTINVQDAVSRQPLSGATLDFQDCGAGIQMTNDSGQYAFRTTAGVNCALLINKAGYVSYEVPLSVDNQMPKELMVLLDRRPDLYEGMVFNARTKEPISGASIMATIPETGEKASVSTDEQGKYALGLKPNTNYRLQFSRPGFVNVFSNVSTGSGTEKDLLGQINLQPAVTNIDQPVAEVSEAASSENENLNASIEELKDEMGGVGRPEAPDRVRSSSPNVPATIAEPAEATEEVTPSIDIVATGYAIQVAAIKGIGEVEPSKYDKLKPIGNLYSRMENGMNKLRIGVFESKEEALEALPKIQTRGFASAFIVPERVSASEEVLLMSEVNLADATTSDTSVDTPAESVVSTSPSETVTEVSMSPYMVRLASYKRPEFFKANKVEGLGSLTTREKGDFTIMLLEGFATLEEAILVQEKVQENGFSGAHIVIEQDGRLVRVNL